MNHRFLSANSLWPDAGLFMVRLLTGIFMIYHGWEVFIPDKMNGYAQWLHDLHFPSATFMAYLGKGTEWVGGILLVLGLLTRIACIGIAGTMAVISFGMGEGRIFTDEQHPFLFVLLAAIFFFTGPGRWSLDQLLFGNARKRLH